MSDVQRANAELAYREYSLVIDELFDAGWPYAEIEALAWMLMLQTISRQEAEQCYSTPDGSDCGCL